MGRCDEPPGRSITLTTRYGRFLCIFNVAGSIAPFRVVLLYSTRAVRAAGSAHTPYGLGLRLELIYSNGPARARWHGSIVVMALDLRLDGRG